MAQDNLARFTADGREPEDPLLRSLLQSAVEGRGALQRLSPRRTVLRLERGDQAWLLKLDAPERPFEALRALVRRPSLQREQRHWKRLADAWPELQPLAQEVVAEQLDAARGCLARPWLDGLRGTDWKPQHLPPVGAGLASLHARGWTDPDLSPDDLLLDTQDRLLPLDLGHARLTSSPATAEARRRDLVQLLGGWPADKAEAFAPLLLPAYRADPTSAASRDDSSDADLLREASTWRDRILHRQSRRCLRLTRDFQPEGEGIRRTEGGGEGPVEHIQGMGAGRGREAFRALYEEELKGGSELRPVALEVEDDGSWTILARRD